MILNCPWLRNTTISQKYYYIPAALCEQLISSLLERHYSATNKTMARIFFSVILAPHFGLDYLLTHGYPPEVISSRRLLCPHLTGDCRRLIFSFTADVIQLTYACCDEYNLGVRTIAGQLNQTYTMLRTTCNVENSRLQNEVCSGSTYNRSTSDTVDVIKERSTHQSELMTTTTTHSKQISASVFVPVRILSVIFVHQFYACVDCRAHHSSSEMKSCRSTWSGSSRPLSERGGRGRAQTWTKFLGGCPAVSHDVVVRHLDVSVASFHTRRELGRRATCRDQLGPYVFVAGRPFVIVRQHAGFRCYPRPSPATATRRRRRSLTGKVGGVTLAEVAATTPLAHRQAVGGQREVSVTRVRHITVD